MSEGDENEVPSSAGVEIRASSESTAKEHNGSTNDETSVPEESRSSGQGVVPSSGGGDCHHDGYSNSDGKKSVNGTIKPNEVAGFVSQLHVDTVKSTETETLSHENPIVFSRSTRWSDVLQSPTIGTFSPSLDPNRPGSLHGLGLRLALQRSKASGLFCRDVANFLLGIATIYDEYGVNLVKVAQTVRPGSLPFDEKALMLQDEFVALYESVRSFGDAFRGLAHYFRSSIAASVRKTLVETSKTVDAANDRYLRVRRDSFQSRQSAVALYRDYKNAVDIAESEVQVWIHDCDTADAAEASSDNENDVERHRLDSDIPWEMALLRLGRKNPEGTRRLIQNLNHVLSCETEYVEAVDKENKETKLSQEMEVVALEKVQETEQDRLILFALSIVDKVFHSEIDMEGAKLVTPKLSTESSFAEGFEKKGKDLLAGLNAGLFKQQSLPYEPGMGTMEAETLGLQPELGELRDNVKAAFSKHEVRIKATETLFKLLEEISELSAQASSELRIRAQAQMGNQTENLISGNVMGPRSGKLWQRTVNTFQYESKLIADAAFTCKKLRTATLEKWVANAPKHLKNEMELDDASWKVVCDSARAEMKSESRYRHSKGQANKARSRASSRGDVSIGSNDSPDRPTPPKPDSSSLVAPPSPFRLFKGGGEVMKKALGQISEDQKEEKDKIAFEEALASKKKATTAYMAYTASRIEKLESQDKEGWKELKGIIVIVLQTASSLRQSRKETLGVEIADGTKNAFPNLPGDLDDWAKTVKERIQQKQETSSPNISYSLSVSKIASTNVRRLLDLTGREDGMPDLEKRPNSDTPIRDRSIQTAGSFDSVTSKINESSSLHQSAAAGAGALKSSPSEASNSNVSEYQQGEKSNDSATHDANSQAFMKQFWSKKGENQSPPKILEIFTCSYRTKEKSAFLTPNLHGRCFVTSDHLYFLAWDNKKFVLKWEDIISARFDKGFMGASSDSAIAITYRSEGTNVAFTLNRLESGDETLSRLQRLLDTKKARGQPIGSKSDTAGTNVPPPPPPDKLLKEMEIVVSKTIKNVSIKSVFESCWEDPVGKKSFYEAWLEDEECFDITTGDWIVAEGNSPFTNPWCSKAGETYTHKRLVTFKFKRTTHLYIGPPIAFVRQMHYIRIEGNDKIVLAIEATFEGIPYSDTFGVEMRWIARRQEANDIKVEVGLFVLFKKNTMLKSQIKSGTISETKNVHLRLFNAVKKACVDTGETSEGRLEEGEEMQENETETTKPEASVFAILEEGGWKVAIVAVGAIAALITGRYTLNFVFGSNTPSDIVRLEMQISELQEEIRALQKSVDLIVSLVKETRL